jgi:hypothetical protein
VVTLGRVLRAFRQNAKNPCIPCILCILFVVRRPFYVIKKGYIGGHRAPQKDTKDTTAQKDTKDTRDTWVFGILTEFSQNSPKHKHLDHQPKQHHPNPDQTNKRLAPSLPSVDLMWVQGRGSRKAYAQGQPAAGELGKDEHQVRIQVRKVRIQVRIQVPGWSW